MALDIMDQSDDIVLNTFVRSKLGMGLPPELPYSSMIDQKTTTDDLDSISSVGRSFFTRDMNSEDQLYLESILKDVGDDLDSLIEKIDLCQERLKRLRVQ